MTDTLTLIVKWEELEQSIKQVEESNMSNLSERVAVMQRLRKEFCELMWDVKRGYVAGCERQSPVESEGRTIVETGGAWYKLYGGTSEDGRGAAKYIRKTQDIQVALRHVKKCEEQWGSLGYVEKVTGGCSKTWTGENAVTKNTRF